MALFHKVGGVVDRKVLLDRFSYGDNGFLFSNKNEKKKNSKRSSIIIIIPRLFISFLTNLPLLSHTKSKNKKKRKIEKNWSDILCSTLNRIRPIIPRKAPCYIPRFLLATLYSPRTPRQLPARELVKNGSGTLLTL